MIDVRPLTENDFDAAWELGRLAFGSAPEQRPAWRMDAPLVRWGAFDSRGRLVGKATDLFHGQWWGGQVLPACGVAGVATEPEQRGRGITRDVLTALLRAARDRGAVVAALYPTTTAVYRSVGFEVGGALRRVDLPTAALVRTSPPAAVTVRAGTGADWHAVRAVYAEVARSGNGLLTREGIPWHEARGDDLPEGLDGVTLAEDSAHRVVGYAMWERGLGYDEAAVLAVPDCLALTADAAQALLSVLASWGTVAPTLRLRPLPWLDAVAVALPLERLREHRGQPWMHRPLDVAAAVGARGWPSGHGSVAVRLIDPLLSWNDRGWRLTVADGAGRLEPADDEPDLRLHVRGWSLLWCGAARAAQVRQAGLLTGGGAADDAALDATLGSGGPAALLDYF